MTNFPWYPCNSRAIGSTRIILRDSVSAADSVALRPLSIAFGDAERGRQHRITCSARNSASEASNRSTTRLMAGPIQLAAPGRLWRLRPGRPLA